MSKDIIIYQPWGGLGDNLQFSTLPELFTKAGYNVYISSENKCRNPEIFDLVWKLNPYIKGISELTPNAGSCRGYHAFTDDFIKNIELVHGINYGNTIYPKIYYTPKIIPELKGTIIYDTTSISSKYSEDFIISSFTSIFNKHPDLKRKYIQFKNINEINKSYYSEHTIKINNNKVDHFKDDILEVNNIFEYCDIIASCKVFVSLFSGNCVLASAIKQDNRFPIIHTIHHTNPLKSYGHIYNFKNLIYYE